MTVGMLWLCTKKELTDNVQAAADYYQKKYGHAPELCLVNPSMLAGKQPPDIEGITVRSYQPVLPGHLWIGFEDMPTEPKSELVK